MSDTLPAFKHTPVAAVPAKVNLARTTFHAQKTKPLEYRLTQLRKLYWGLKDNEAKFVEAFSLDLRKSAFEVAVTEVGWCTNDIVFTCNNLEKWARDEKAPDIPLTNAPLGPKIRKDPLGVVLVIGAYNFPVQLALGPMIGAIAAGNTAILKPSELCPNVAAILQKTIEDSLDSSAYIVVQGAVPETSALLEEKWDKIFYTGGAVVGTIIAKKAAETLTPVTLELGAKNPAFVTEHADPRLAARRLLWGKILNAGQVCLSQNYVLVQKDILPAFVSELKAALNEFYPNGAKDSPDYARIVNARHFHRIKSMLDNSNGKIIFGGTMDEKDLFIEPTGIIIDDHHDAVIQEEIFGPLFPILAFETLGEAIKLSNEVFSTPLGLYPFGTKEETDRILRETRSGGASVNDSYFHGSIPTLAFGGVGESGQGSYRGRASFDCFTHRRSITSTPSWVESFLSIRYPPYANKLGKFKRMADLKPNFDRQGRVSTSWVTWLLKLGGRDGKNAAGRYVVVLLGEFLRYHDSIRQMLTSSPCSGGGD
ncbi:MAG: hypothetical protein M1833_005153 [Piccolia ochrophora]|nr:MAG: hypothetical protein M1833_005153 [Piccolia ochrophora]